MKYLAYLEKYNISPCFHVDFQTWVGEAMASMKVGS